MIFYAWTALSGGSQEASESVAMGITDDRAKAMRAGEESLGSGRAIVVIIEAVRPARARWPGTGFSCGAIRMVFLALAGWNHETQDLLPATTSEWAPIRGERGLARVTRAGAHAARLVRKKKLAERAADG